MKLLSLVCILATFQAILADQFAVLIASSKLYWNYRHQADVCHSYNLLREKGIPQENIITFSYNDCADSKYNIYPGKLFNKQSGNQPGVDVNKGCKIDYEKGDVTPENFLAVLTGDFQKVKGGNGRVLNSTSSDDVFVYLTDHGAPGQILFPEDNYLQADQLMEAFQTMHDKNLYNKMTFYLETCNSGSMLLKMKPEWNIYAVSAAKPEQNSYATYCYPDDIVDGEHLWTCLSDEFSKSWMNTVSNYNTKLTTLQQQFEYAVDSTQADPQQYGDLSFTSDPVGQFMGYGIDGDKKENKYGFLAKIKDIFNVNLINSKKQKEEQKVVTSMNNRYVELNFLVNLFQRNPSAINFAELNKYLSTSKKFSQIFQNFEKRYGDLIREYYNSLGLQDTNYECYRFLQSKLKENFGNINEQSLDHLELLYKYCGVVNNVYKHTQFEL